jgi:magnesium-transporting ATPase (P-type)
MTVFAQAFYVAFAQDVSFRKYGQSNEDEAKMPYKLSEMYVSSKNQISRFFSDFFYLSLFGFVIAFL